MSYEIKEIPTADTAEIGVHLREMLEAGRVVHHYSDATTSWFGSKDGGVPALVQSMDVQQFGLHEYDAVFSFLADLDGKGFGHRLVADPERVTVYYWQSA